MLETTSSNGKRTTIIDYKKWKDVSYKILQYFINICYVRINELVLIYQLIVNILTVKPVWKMLRLSFIAVYYSLIGFRSIKEYKLIKTRIKRVLLWLQFFVWFRVIFGKLAEIGIEAYRIVVTANAGSNDAYNLKNKKVLELQTTLNNYLELDSFAKILTVIELFLVEIVYGLYNSDIFLERQERILEKKKMRAELISLCMAYQQNENKLMKVVKCY